MSSPRAAIYHFTNISAKRPSIYQAQLNGLQQFAISKGFSIDGIFCDMDLHESNHPEFEKFLSQVDRFDILVVKDFYHLGRNTLKAMRIVTELQKKGILVYTIENGLLSWRTPPYDASLKIATYCCTSELEDKTREISKVQNDILALFAKKKTNWIVIAQYEDYTQNYKQGDQQQFSQLMSMRKDYNLLLVHKLSDIHRSTANFCKIREQLQLDIYSLQDGYLKYEEDKSI